LLAEEVVAGEIMADAVVEEQGVIGRVGMMRLQAVEEVQRLLLMEF